MDLSEQAYYELALRLAFRERTGEAFQELFAGIMSRRYPGDFFRMRPWGSKGDQKNDGYLQSQRKLFQVYAPNEMSERDAIRKMDEDFYGALPHWEEYFDVWIFTHNAWELGPGHAHKLLELDKVSQSVRVKQWGYEPIKDIFFELSPLDIRSLLGHGRAPTIEDQLRIGYEDIKHVLTHLTIMASVADEEVHPVPEDKLEINQLSEGVKTLIKNGLRKSRLVHNYFDKHPDPLVGQRVAATFTHQYNKLKAQGLPPDLIFDSLFQYAGGLQFEAPEQIAAVFTVLAFLFESCDIFERLQSERS